MILSEIIMNIDNKLAVARAKYLQQINDKEREIKDLQNKILVIEEIENDGHPVPSPAIDKQGVYPIIDHHKYSKMGLSDAALDALRNLRATHVKGTTKTMIAKHMVDKGFKPTGKNFGISVDTALRRAVDAGKISSMLVDGKRIYTLSPVEELSL